MPDDQHSPGVEPSPFDWLTFARRQRAFERFAAQGGAAIFLLHAPHCQQRDASASDVAMIGRLYGVPASVLMAVADLEGDRSLCRIEANAGRLRCALDTGASLSDIFFPAVLGRIIEIETALGGMGA